MKGQLILHVLVFLIIMAGPPARAGSLAYSLRDGNPDLGSSATTGDPSIPLVNESPSCDAGGPYTGNVGQEISFDGSGSYDPDGFIVSYAWDFGDGEVAVDPVVVHAYSAGGPYTVTLTVEDNEGAVSDCTASVVAFALAERDVGYASTGINDGGRLLLIDLNNGAGTLVGSMGIFVAPGIAVNSHGEIYANDSLGGIFRVDAATGTSVFIGSTNQYFTALAFDESDVLYGVTNLFPCNLFMIDPTTAEATLIGPTGDCMSGLAFDPTSGVLYASASGANGGATVPDGVFTIDKTSGATTLIGTTGLGGGTPDILFDSDGTLYGSKGGGMVPDDNFIRIDKTTGQGTIIGPIGFTSVSGLAALPPYLIAVQEPLPSRFTLDAALPNPFNPWTRLGYELGERSRVRLMIFDAQGLLVRTLVASSLQEAGHHESLWDGCDDQGSKVSSGVYIYRLTASYRLGEFSDARKMLMIK